MSSNPFTKFGSSMCWSSRSFCTLSSAPYRPVSLSIVTIDDTEPGVEKPASSSQRPP
ncbi:hypothetical protein WG66_011371 [Moniliophthora roreri]|nr:hypothetical protein WG66_011371 [Moniliophthora roreri]